MTSALRAASPTGERPGFDVAHLSRIRTDVVGSLLRPAALKEVRRRYDAGETSAEALRAAEDRAVRDAIRLQEEAGLDVVSDGEMRRLNFQDSFGAAVEGFDVAKPTQDGYEKDVAATTPFRRYDIDFAAHGAAIVRRRPAKERLRLADNVPLREYEFARTVAAKPVKVSIIGPDRISQRFDAENSKAVYATVDAFITDVVAIQRAMIESLIAAGCRYVHIDAPGFTAYVDPPSLEQMRARGEDPMANFARSLEAEAAVVRGFDAVFGIHLCRGNQRSMWHREGTYDAIAERLFNELPHQRFLLEYDSPRAGSFEPLRFMPRGKIAVLGLVSTKTVEVETVDDLVRRLEEAARYLPLDQLAISPQCGFASDVVGNLVGEDVQKRKLEIVCEVARRVWG